MLYNENMLRLRRFAPQDTSTIITWPQSVTEAHWWAGPQTRWPIPTEVVQHWHDDPDVHPYILTTGTTLLGYGELWIDAVEQEVELARLIVAPQHRGQGVGRALARRLLEQARTAYPQVFLRVFPDNQIAITCYLRAGFAPVSTADQQAFNHGQPMDYFWMRHVLDRPRKEQQPTAEQQSTSS